jgi:hypothetical protein
VQSVKETQRLRHESLKEDIAQIKEMQITFRETSEGMISEVSDRALKVCSQIKLLGQEVQTQINDKTSSKIDKVAHNLDQIEQVDLP